MKFRKKLEIGTLLIYSKLSGKRIPIFVCWYLTNRCNMHCKYCDISKIKSRELSTNQIFKIIDELSSLGCKCINFSGGEPLLRKDIGKIIDYAKSKGIYVGLDSNGLLVKDKIEKINNVDLLQLSFEGLKEVQDFQRGKGSYDKVIEAIKIARMKGIKTAVSVTITKYNAPFLDRIVEFIEKEKILAHFQPVAPIPLGPVSFKKVEIPKDKYIEVIDFLINAKKRCKFIVNTTAGLRYLRERDKNKIDCGALSINCVIAPNGNLYPCNGLYRRTEAYNCAEMGFKEAFNKSKPMKCNSCLCSSTLDVALLYSKILSFDLAVIFDIINSGLK